METFERNSDSATAKNGLLNLFKDKEMQWRSVMPNQTIYAVRLDGKAFHTFTKQFTAPYSDEFMDAMDTTASYLAKTFVSGALFAYVQSDEITVFFTDLMTDKALDDRSNKWKLEKILSTYASAATGAFLKALPDVDGLPVFDARVLTMDSFEDICLYMNWRRLDARKNSISMAAEQVCSHKQLIGVSTKERAAMLVGTPYEVLPQGFFEGRLISYTKGMKVTEFLNKKTGTMETSTKIGKIWSIDPATREKTAEVIDYLEDAYIDYQMAKAK